MSVTRVLFTACGFPILLDEEDWLRAMGYMWNGMLRRDGVPKYVAATIDQKKVYLHRFVMEPPDGIEVDHINGNGLDNRRSNLRLATSAQNRCNVGVKSHNQLGVKGVRLTAEGKFQVRITSGGKCQHLGCFDTVEEAQAAYIAAAQKHHGEFARAA